MHCCLSMQVGIENILAHAMQLQMDVHTYRALAQSAQLQHSMSQVDCHGEDTDPLLHGAPLLGTEWSAEDAGCVVHE